MRATSVKNNYIKSKNFIRTHILEAVFINSFASYKKAILALTLYVDGGMLMGYLYSSGMPPHMAPRPGMPHMAPAPTAGAIPSRPTAPAAQPVVTKPLFPSAAQVGIMHPPTTQAYY